MEAPNAGGVGENHDSRRISGYRIDTDHHASVNMPNSREQSRLIVCSAKLKPKFLISNRRLHSTCCTIEANY